RREHQRACADVGAHGAGHPERDEPGATGRQIAGGGEQLDLRRREIDRDRVAGDRAILAPERPPEVVARPHLEGGVALAEPERAAARRRIRTRGTQAFVRDRWGTMRMIPCRTPTAGEGDRVMRGELVFVSLALFAVIMYSPRG